MFYGTECTFLYGCRRSRRRCTSDDTTTSIVGIQVWLDSYDQETARPRSTVRTYVCTYINIRRLCSLYIHAYATIDYFKLRVSCRFVCCSYSLVRGDHHPSESRSYSTVGLTPSAQIGRDTSYVDSSREESWKYSKYWVCSRVVIVCCANVS
jgi:hypothetical protein